MGGVDESAHVSLDHFDQFFGDWSWVIHAWAHIDLDDPRVKILIYHEIITNHLKKSFFASDTPLTSFNTPNYNIFNLFLYDLPFILSNKLAKSLHIPHGIFDSGSFMMFLDGVVGKVHEFIVNIVQIKLVTAKSDIALLIKPYNWRVVIFYENPLSDIKFFAIDQKRILYIFLDDKLTIFAETVIGNVV